MLSLGFQWRDSKGKFHPKTGHEGPEGEWRYSLTLSLTSVLDGVDGQRHASPALLPRYRPVTHCVGGWLVPRVSADGCEKTRPPPGFDPRTVQPVASRYTDYVIPPQIQWHNI